MNNGAFGPSGHGPFDRYPVNGQCLLTASNNGLLLSPLNGHCLVIGGRPRQVPSAGVFLTGTTNVTAGTFYYVYASWSGALRLEISTTAYTTHNDGTAVKSGDPSRALVGIAYSDGNANFTDSSGARFVRSWFNRRRIVAQTGPYAKLVTNTLLEEIEATKRAQFVCFTEDTVEIYAQSISTNNADGGVSSYAVWIDGALPTGLGELQETSGGANQPHSVSARSLTELSTGYHYASAAGRTSSGTATTFSNVVSMAVIG